MTDPKVDLLIFDLYLNGYHDLRLKAGAKFHSW
jgi:hypothetical protein